MFLSLKWNLESYFRKMELKFKPITNTRLPNQTHHAEKVAHSALDILLGKVAHQAILKEAQ